MWLGLMVFLRVSYLLLGLLEFLGLLGLLRLLGLLELDGVVLGLSIRLTADLADCLDLKGRLPPAAKDAEGARVGP